MQRLLLSSRLVVPLLGAGISKPLGLPLGAELARWICEFAAQAGAPLDGVPDGVLQNPLEIAQRLRDTRPDLRGSMHEFVAARLRTLEASVRPSRALRALAATPNTASLVVTLNYDRLVERAAEEIGRPVRELGIEDVRKLMADGLSGPAGPRQELRVLHLHGSLRDDPRTLVLDAESYADRIADGRTKSLFDALLANYSICILGSSFEEQYLATVMHAHRPSQPRHVIVCRESLGQRIRRGESQLSAAQHNVAICEYPSGEDDVLDPFCERLVRAEGSDAAQQTPHVVTARVLEAPIRYAPRTLTLLPVQPGATEEEQVEEQALAQLTRTLVLGGPGTGKTWLLERLARSPLAGERAAFVRLRDVGDGIGSPVPVLSAWLEKSAGLDDRGSLGIDMVVSGRERAHVLLDGLDELPREVRANVANAVVRIGDAMPHLRLTVSSRPGTAVEMFPSSWQRAELVCDAQWKHALLHLVGRTDEELAVSLGPAYPAIAPLLDVPFFLHRTLELLAQGEQPADGLDLALLLLDSVIERDPKLRPIRSDVRRWLGRVALEMALSGSAVVGPAEAASLAEGLELGNVTQAAGLLAERSLLQIAAGHYAFQHRLLGEALVAERLLQEPENVWLDVLAPVANGLSALLDDWRGVATLLLPRSRSWRATIAARDPRAAARLTPSTASVEERETAARLLWNDALEKDVWLHRERGPGPGTDAAIVGALVAAGGLDRLTEEVRREALGGSTRFRRGSAVAVVAEAPLTDAEAVLRRVLVDDTDPVVSRLAAGASLDLGLTALARTIERRAQSAQDRLEAQTLTMVVLRLTPPRERTAVALSIHLAAPGRGAVQDWNVMDGMSAAEKVAWLAASLAARRDENWFVQRELPGIIDAIRRASPRVAAQVAYVAAGARVDDATVVEFVRRRDHAAVGLLDALDEELVEPFEILMLLNAAGVARLAKHGARHELLEQIARWSPERRVSSPSISAPFSFKHASTKSTLADLLAESDSARRIEIYADRGSRIVTELREADPEARSSVASWLEKLWEGRDLRAAVRVNGDSASLEWWAGAVLELGPASDMPLDSDCWAEVALCEWLYDQQYRWLLRERQPGYVSTATAMNPSPRSVGDLAALSGGSDIDDLAAAARSAGGRFPERATIRLVDAFTEAGRSDLLAELSARDGDVSKFARPKLAQLGDLTAQREELESLRETLAAGLVPDRRGTEKWLAAVDGPGFFDLLVKLYSLAARAAPADASPFDSVAEPLQDALERTDTRRAVEFYDELIATQPWVGAQWVLERRDDAVQRVIANAGRAAAIAAAVRIGLPFRGEAAAR